MRGFVVAAEGDLIGKRMIGSEEQKETVLPVLLEGNQETAFPNLLQGRVYADFRSRELYVETTLDLIGRIHGIDMKGQMGVELRELIDPQRRYVELTP
jgi:hypothetical protein